MASHSNKLQASATSQVRPKVDAFTSFKVVEPLGEGKFTNVDLVEDRNGNKAARKRLKPEFTGDTAILLFFSQEVAALNLVDHPGVPQFLSYGESERPYLIMELAHGKAIDDVYEDPNVSWAHKLKAFSRLTEILEGVHQKGIVHRDITPGNILVSGSLDEPVIKLVDFGLCKLPNRSDPALKLQGPAGTPEFMSPEQIQYFQGVPLDHRSDLYSLGVLMYAICCSGQLPFKVKEDGQREDFFMQHLYMRPRAMTSLVSDIPPAVVSIVERLLQKLPGSRFQTASELRAAIDSCMEEISVKTA